MSQRAGPENSRTKERPWFHSSIGATLTPAGRELFEKYSKIPPGEVEDHIYKAVCFPSSSPPLNWSNHTDSSSSAISPGI